ncbi:DUF5696 domain-containing protein [Paenibacillus sp. CAU 1782]
MNMASRLALLAACAWAALLIAGCSDSEQAPEGEAEYIAASFEKGSPISAAFTDSRAEGMKGVAESQALKLFVDETSGAIAVLHKDSGELWLSNPGDRETDTVAAGVNKDVLSSQLKLEFYNSFGQQNSVNSFTDSAAYGQISAELIPNGVQVSYMFGTSKKTMDDLPMMVQKERFEEKLLGKLDNAGQRALKIVYAEDKEKGVYTRSDGALKGLQLDRALKAFDDAGYTEEDLLFDIEENNLSQVKPEPRIFLASVQYTLDGDALVAKVPMEGIVYPDEYPVGTLSLLSFFGAGGTEEEGSIFVPDGSGALIHFNNGKTRYSAYQQPIYGADQTISRVENIVNSENIRLPVFGIIKEKGAVFGIVEEGDSAAFITADVSGRLNSYNYVHPIFTVLNKGELTLNANEQQRSLPRFQEKPTQSDFSVRYVFLTGEEASYQGMAAYYQQYLLKGGGLPQELSPDSSDEMPFYLELVGSIDKKKHFAGVPYRSLEPLTTFEQAQDILTELQERGVADIRLRYSGWFNGGLDHKVPDNISVDGTIGGGKGLRNFMAYAGDAGITVFPDVAILNAHTNKGFSATKEASRTLRDVSAEVYPVNLALNRRDRSQAPSYVISPSLIGNYVDGMLKDFSKYDTGGIALRDLADKLNSDFRANKGVDRVESKMYSVEALQKIADAELAILAEGGNAYAFPYLSDIVNMPMGNSGFKIQDEAVPFYQMVVRGYIDYAGAPYNLSSYTDVKRYVLKNLEYGAGLSFKWIYAPNHNVKDTDYTDLYAVQYDQWIDQAAELQQEVNGFLQSVRHDRIIDHEKLADGVYKTVYENGYVIVNYNRHPVTVNGISIEAEGYATGGVQS